MSTQRFTTTIVQSGTKLLVEIPFNPNEIWGEKQRHHVTGSINGCMIRGPLDADGTQYFLPLGAAWCRDNAITAGTVAEVVLMAEGPQVDTFAPDIAAALDAEPQVKTFFESLATFYRKGYIRWIEGAKRPETRSARIAEMIGLLKAGKKQR